MRLPAGWVAIVSTDKTSITLHERELITCGDCIHRDKDCVWKVRPEDHDWCSRAERAEDEGTQHIHNHAG